jgi:hypothetical protein
MLKKLVRFLAQVFNPPSSAKPPKRENEQVGQRKPFKHAAELRAAAGLRGPTHR